MSDTSRTDDSTPSLSSYPPAFVSLITTFIKRAEEAETRAHKALVVLKAKDDQVLQLQQRLAVLEKLASKLEEAMVPPLEIPQSPDSIDEVNYSFHRDTGSNKKQFARDTSNYPPMETLYERYPNAPLNKHVGNVEEEHNCYIRCQNLIDGLERSNCQLREALAAESKQRVREHEQYVETLDQITKVIKHLETNNSARQNKLNSECVFFEALREHSIPVSLLNKVKSILGAAGDNESIRENHQEQHKISEVNCAQMVVVDKENLKENLNKAESIIVSMIKRLESGRENCTKISKLKRKKKSMFHISSKESTSSYHTPESSSSKKVKIKGGYSRHFLNILKRKNRKLKLKYQYMCGKFRESLDLCEKLQKDLVFLTEHLKIKHPSDKIDKFVQTETLCHSLLVNGNSEKHSSRPINIMQGRLDAASKVMAKQSKQIQDLQKQLMSSQFLVNSLKKRISKAESVAAEKDLLKETAKRKLEDCEARNAVLAKEVHNLKESVVHFEQELLIQMEAKNKIEKEKDNSEKKFEDMKIGLESKLYALSATLQQKDTLNDLATDELEGKLNNLRGQFVAQISEASARLMTADNKIQELYLGIETFLKLLFSLNTPELSPSSQAQALLLASDILQLEPGQVQTFLYSSRCDSRLVNKWTRECHRLIHKKVFAKNLGQCLLDAVLEAKLM